MYGYFSGGISLSKPRLYKYLCYCIAYELEAEMKAYQLLIDKKIPFNKKMYKEDSNFYLYSWGIIYFDKEKSDIINKSIPRKIKVNSKVSMNI